MQNEHVTRFGDPNSPTGARYLAFDIEGLIQVGVDLEYARLKREGIALVPMIETLILDNIKRDFEILGSNIRARGIPQKIIDLFSFTKKGKAVAYAKNIEISEYELFLLIHNAELLGYSYSSKIKDFVPSELNMELEHVHKLLNADTRKFARRLLATKKQRKRIHAHLFENVSGWHCFYFTYEDIQEQNNHFVKGVHLHYLSHLWAGSKEHVWNSFDARITSIKDIHIKFEPFHFLEAERLDKDFLAEIGQKPKLIVINPKLPTDCETTAIPLAQIITRGIWSADVFPGKKRIFKSIEALAKDD